MQRSIHSASEIYFVTIYRTTGGEGDEEDEMVGWHHRLDGHEFEQAPGVGGGEGSPVCCSPWGRRVGHD